MEVSMWAKYQKILLPTSTRLDDLVDLLAKIHGSKIERLDNGTSFEKLGSVIGRRSKLLDVLATNTCSRLLAPDNRAVAEIALDKEDHLLITHENGVGADSVQPALH
jgi:hypothetical protein